MILEYHEHDLYYSNPLFSGMNHFSLTGTGRTANIVFTWWHTATEQGHKETPYWREARIEPLSCQLQRTPAYDPEPTDSATLLIQLWFCYHTESPCEADARSSAAWFCSDSVTTQRAPAKLRHDRVSYNSAPILLPHREPQQINSTVEQLPQNWTVYDPCMFKRDEPTSGFITEIYIDWF